MRKKGQINQPRRMISAIAGCELNYAAAAQLRLSKSEMKQQAEYYAALDPKVLFIKQVLFRKRSGKRRSGGKGAYLRFLVINGSKGEKAYLKPTGEYALVTEIPMALELHERNYWMSVVNKVFRREYFVQVSKAVPVGTQIKRPYIDSNLPTTLKGDMKFIYRTYGGKTPGPDPTITQQRDRELRQQWQLTRGKGYQEEERLLKIREYAQEQVVKGRSEFQGMADGTILRAVRSKQMT